MTVRRIRLSSGVLGFVLVAIAGAGLAGCNRAVDVTAKPPEAADRLTAESQPAAIYVAAALDLRNTEDEISRQLPIELASISQRVPRASCVAANGKPVCSDVRLTGHITRDAQIEFTGTPRGLELRVPLHYDLVAQPIGPGPGIPLRGKLAVTASFAMALDEHWQPVIKLDPVFKWEDGTKIVVLAGEASVQAGVETVLTQRLGKLPPGALAGILPGDLRKQVELAWRYLHYPFALSENDQIWLRGTPLGLRYAGITTKDGATELRMAVVTRMQTFVGERPAPLPPSPLPSPGTGPEAAGDGILLPADLKYQQLSEAAAHRLPAIPASSIASETVAFALAVRSLGFFASGRRLGIAVHFDQLPGGSWMSGHAVSYFLATPILKPGGAQIGLSQTELYVSGTKSTGLKNEMPFLTDARFAEAIGAALVIDVNDKLTEAAELVKRHVSLPLTQGMKLILEPGEPRIAHISPGIDGLRLQIEVAAEMTVRRDGTDVAADSADPVKATP